MVSRRTTITLLMCLTFCVCFSSCKETPEPLEEKAMELEKALLERDSLLSQMAEITSFLNEVDDSLAMVSQELQGTTEEQQDESIRMRFRRNMKSVKEQMSTYRLQLNTLEKQYAKLGSKQADATKTIRNLLQNVDAKKRTIAELEQTITSLKDTVQNLQGTVTELQDSVEKAELRTRTELERSKMISEKLQSSEQMFFIMGTNDSLQALGVIKREGKVLGFGGTLVPVSGKPDSLFTPVNMYADTILPIPAGFVVDKVVSNHSRKYATIIKEEHLRETNYANSKVLLISDPQSFWKGGKHLIILLKKQ